MKFKVTFFQICMANRMFLPMPFSRKYLAGIFDISVGRLCLFLSSSNLGRELGFSEFNSLNKF